MSRAVIIVAALFAAWFSESIAFAQTRFDWSGLPSSGAVNALLNATVTAKDANDAVSTGFNGAANLRAYVLYYDRTIGSPFTSSPRTSQVFNTTAQDSRATLLYTAEELGGVAGWLGGISFTMASAGSPNMSNFTVRLKLTSSTTMENAAWETVGWTTVYTSTAQDGSTPNFAFTRPFWFDGTSSVLVDISFDNNTAGTATTLRYTTSANPRVLSGTSASAHGNPLDWSAATGPAFQLSNELPAMDIYFARDIGLLPGSPAGFSNGVWSGQVSIPVPGSTRRSLGISPVEASAWMLVSEASGAMGFSPRIMVNPAPITLPPSSSATIFTDNFESGTTLGASWSTAGSFPIEGAPTNAPRAAITTVGAPRGTQHLMLDSSVSLTGAQAVLSAAELTLNLAGRSNVTLEYWAKFMTGETVSNPPGAQPFASEAPFDGIAVSADGTNWYLAAPTIYAEPLGSGAPSFNLPTTYSAMRRVVLDPIIQRYGLSYNSAFRVKFVCLTRASAPSVGMAVDDVFVKANNNTAPALELPARFAEGGTQNITVRLPSAPAVNVTVNLASAAPARLTVPASVTVLAGQTTATASITAPNNGFVESDGGFVGIVTVTASGYPTGYANTFIPDNDVVPAISWITPAPIAYGTALSATQLNATSDVAGMFAYDPPIGTLLDAGTNTLTAVFTATDTTNYVSPLTNTVTLVVNKTIPSVTWSNPAAITYGTSLSKAQLNATSDVAGTFAYDPPLGTLPDAGTNTLTAVFTATDTTNYVSPVTNAVSLIVEKAVPSVTWTNPAPIVYGTALSAAELNATSSVAGTFTYGPSLGTIVNAGTNVLTAVFAAADTANYVSPLTNTVSLVVNKATPAITWSDPAAITYGTALSGAQLNATSDVAGSFAYDPASGTIVNAGTNVLTAVFTAADAANYVSPVTNAVSLIVEKAVPSVTWTNPAPIVYGTALSAAELNATSSVAGTFTYDPASGTMVNAGTNVLTAVFEAADADNYVSPVTNTVSLVVEKAAPSVTWTNPAPIVYGTALSGAQLNATSSVAGTFTYDPPLGTIVPAGTNVLTAVFAAADTANYVSPVTNTVSLVVEKAAPSVTWTNPAPIVYGTALSGAQLNATSDVAGTFTYDPASGTIVNAGTNVLTAVFEAADADNYVSPLTNTVNLVVEKAAPSVTWTNPAPIVYGTALSAAELNATSDVAGTFTYGPSLGTIVNAGTNVLTAVFEAADADNYVSPLTNTVSLVVAKATPVITWNDPAPILYGMPLSAAELNAASSVDGTFAYTPPPGAMVNAGTNVLTAVFTAADAENYVSPLTNTVSLVVAKAPLGPVSAPTASPITYGQSLSNSILSSGDASVLRLVTTLAGNGGAGSVDGPGAFAQLGSPFDVAVDGAGNAYVADATGASIRKVTPGGEVSTVAGNLGSPYAVALDSAGNIYVVDAFEYKIFKITPEGAVTSLAGGGYGEDARFADPRDIAVDGAGNVYIADTLNNKIRKITPDGYVSTFAGGFDPENYDSATALNFPRGVAVDGAGNVYVADSGNHKIRKITPEGAVSTLAGNGYEGFQDGNGDAASFYFPTSVWLDAAGNVYVADQLNHAIRKVTPGGDVTTLAGDGNFGFADGDSSTARFSHPNGVAADAAGNVYVADLGNRRLRKIAPDTAMAGTWAFVSPATKPDLGTSSHEVIFTPSAGANYGTLTAMVDVTVGQGVPPVTWPQPAAITYGTALSGTQLNATSDAEGTFVYDPPVGTVLPAGTHTLSAEFTATDTVNYLSPVTNTVTLVVNKVVPVITWPDPAAITYGTALSGEQLNATSDVGGWFEYDPPEGTIFNAGTHTLNVTFHADDPDNHESPVNDTATLVVNKAVPVITWANPAAITYGTPLSSTQLNATSDVGGWFEYDPPEGTIFNAGTHTLNVTFHADDPDNHESPVNDTATLVVNKAVPVITWANPAAITYGTPLSSTQLNATSDVGGLFVYSPAEGAILGVGTSTLSVEFTPDDTNNYVSPVTGTASLVVLRAGASFSEWSANAVRTPGLVTKYAFGGATNMFALSEQPVISVGNGRLSVTIIVRTNDSNLVTYAEAGSTLTNWTTNGITMTPSTNAAPVPEGHQRRVYSIELTNNPTRHFLRGRAILNGQ